MKPNRDGHTVSEIQNCIRLRDFFGQSELFSDRIEYKKSHTQCVYYIYRIVEIENKKDELHFSFNSQIR